jgi:HlyD family secretion protein
LVSTDHATWVWLARRLRSSTKARRPFWIAALLVLSGIAAWSGLGRRRAPFIEVSTAAVTKGPIVRRISASGTLQAVATVQVGAQVSGTVQSIDADFNTIVHAGQVMAKLDPALFAAALGEAQAAFVQAQAAKAQAEASAEGLQTAVDDARMKLTRAEELGARGIIPQSDLDAARIAMDEAVAALGAGKSQVNQARAAVGQAQAAVDQARVNLERTIITSPIDGIVVSRNVDVGQTVAASVQAPVLFSVAADLRHMQLEVDIDEADIGGVQPGGRAMFQVEAYPDQIFAGTVSEVRLQPVAEETTTATTVATSTAPPTSSVVATAISYATIVEVENPDEKLRLGMTASVSLDGLRREEVVRIPNAALSFRPPVEILDAIDQTLDEPRSVVGESSGESRAREVWEYDGARFARISVHTGLASSEWTELLAGALRPGDLLVTGAAEGKHAAR